MTFDQIKANRNAKPISGSKRDVMKISAGDSSTFPYRILRKNHCYKEITNTELSNIKGELKQLLVKRNGTNHSYFFAANSSVPLYLKKLSDGCPFLEVYAETHYLSWLSLSLPKLTAINLKELKLSHFLKSSAVKTSIKQCLLLSYSLVVVNQLAKIGLEAENLFIILDFDICVTRHSVNNDIALAYKKSAEKLVEAGWEVHCIETNCLAYILKTLTAVINKTNQQKPNIVLLYTGVVQIII